jgi:hypothetical protein
MMDDIRPHQQRVAAAETTPPESVEEKDIQEPKFKPPEEVAGEEISEIEEIDKPEVITGSGRRKLKMPSLNLTRKQTVIISAALGLVLAAGLIWKFSIHKKPAPAPPVAKQEVKKEPPKPTTVAARLSGVQVSPELDKLPVTGVMIENSPDARPQSGLKDAGVIFEAIAEGGITRFLTLFQTEQPDYIGPVRSVRPYYLDFLAPFDAGIAHAGGSGEALAQVRSGAFKDLDQFFNPGAYQRVSTRYAPHNLYTSRAALLNLQNQKGWGSSTFTGFPRKSEKASPNPTARSIDFSISGYLYNSHYDYDATTNTYKRSEGGKPHTDERSGAQLSPKVVIAVVMHHGYAGIYSTYTDLGSDKAYIFQDGTVTEGIWEKPNRNTQIRFGEANGSPLALDAGQTWITLVSSPSEVVYKP